MTRKAEREARQAGRHRYAAADVTEVLVEAHTPDASDEPTSEPVPLAGGVFERVLRAAMGQGSTPAPLDEPDGDTIGEDHED